MFKPLFYASAAVAVLVGCGEKAPETTETSAKIDYAKLETISGGFHGIYFDVYGVERPMSAPETDFLMGAAPQATPLFGQAGFGGDPVDIIAQDSGDGKKPGAGAAEGDAKPGGNAGGGLSYAEKCEEAGVPLFPPLPPSAPDWKKTGDLKATGDKSTRVLNNPDYFPNAEIWVFENDKGICTALYRHDKSDKTKHTETGIICQSLNGKVCYFATRTMDNKPIPVGTQKGLTAKDIAGADVLNLNCTNCHRGANAFINHPDTGLNDAYQTPQKPMSPVDPGSTKYGKWSNGKRLKGLKDGCGSCHSEASADWFAEPTVDWCEKVLRPAIGVTMPHPDPTDFDKDILKDLDALDKICAAAVAKANKSLPKDAQLKWKPLPRKP